MNINDYEHFTQTAIIKLREQKAKLNGEIDALTIRRDAIERKIVEIKESIVKRAIIEHEFAKNKGYSLRQFIAEEIVRFLLDTGYVEAAEAVAKEYEI